MEIRWIEAMEFVFLQGLRTQNLQYTSLGDRQRTPVSSLPVRHSHAVCALCPLSVPPLARLSLACAAAQLGFLATIWTIRVRPSRSAL